MLRGNWSLNSQYITEIACTDNKERLSGKINTLKARIASECKE